MRVKQIHGNDTSFLENTAVMEEVLARGKALQCKRTTLQLKVLHLKSNLSAVSTRYTLK